MKSFIITIAAIAILFATGCNNTDRETEEKWFPFTPENTHDQGVIGMQKWLDAPAGKHGFVQVNGDHLTFENGENAKFWGTNICSRLPFMEAEKADSFVNFLNKYGVNAVRLHKFSWYAYDGERSTKFAPEKFKPFDYLQAQLRDKGIYYGWSHIYGHRVMPGDSSRLLAYEEIKNLEYPWSHLNGSTSGLVNFAPDLQELAIDLTVDMLEHVNPHTGLRYADDPALMFIEFQNENNIFWSSIEKALEQAPTYRALLCKQFSKWLIEKYASQKALEHAWGQENIPEGESLAQQNIYPSPNHGIFSWEYEKALEENRDMPRHILDKMRFLYETQMDFYKKFEAAIRETGYEGVLIGSCWQAGSGISHFYNLHADYSVGMIDRHNYFGGGAGGHGLDTGAVKNNSMLQKPGSGLLSAGMQQVKNRPFAFSEWMSLVPNQWTAEAAPIIAAYGMGLQGWDASFSFATDIPRFSRYLESEGHGVYNATSPLHMGLYPALARMIYRGDLKESEVIATRNVHIPSLNEGELSFNEITEQGHDVKNFKGTLPQEALAIGKFPIHFTDEYLETKIPDLSAYRDTINHTIKSSTGQLEWHYPDNGYFTINSEGTKGVVGFLPKQTIQLGNWSIRSDNKFAVILATSLDKNKNLKETDRILVTTVARGKNTGMKYTENGDYLQKTGDKPLLLEPVNLTLGLPENINYQVEVLDQDGQETGKILSTKNGKITLNGGKHKTIYYLLERKD